MSTCNCFWLIFVPGGQPEEIVHRAVELGAAGEPVFRTLADPALHLRFDPAVSQSEAGGELVDGDGPTQRVHVWGPRTSLEAEGYEPVW